MAPGPTDLATIHASCVVIGGRGVLIRGAPGSGKTTLALALVETERDAGRPAALVADDRTALHVHGGRLEAHVPPTIAGLAEVRGLGIVTTPFVAAATVDLCVDLVDPAEIARMPEPEARRTELAGVELPRLALPAAGGGDLLAAVIAVRFALRALGPGGS
ncbi:HPr kinase/phosphorylase [Methylobrevis albus]|uniref:HPr kinase/phosphatase C-terminal domain-containing protein n=1 Tax=Methylobrevis albus TaxID=2793297 RepID=A0A931HZU0_9HYPH|nr:HPr kinase/phosphatase C-terminal domain-containing protein [Methylobrevis albus]MBH0237767.1 HPr kinase/phosphatase C-terminal domain-containing protein [Methylobrevis albus]